MTEKRFTYWEEDIGQMLIPQCRDNGKTVARSVYECVDLLNALHEENQTLRVQLNLCSDQRNEFHRGARENANRVGKLEKENEQLKGELRNLRRLANEIYMEKTE